MKIIFFADLVLKNGFVYTVDKQRRQVHDHVGKSVIPDPIELRIQIVRSHLEEGYKVALLSKLGRKWFDFQL